MVYSTHTVAVYARDWQRQLKAVLLDLDGFKYICSDYNMCPEFAIEDKSGLAYQIMFYTSAKATKRYEVI